MILIIAESFTITYVVLQFTKFTNFFFKYSRVNETEEQRKKNINNTVQNEKKRKAAETTEEKQKRLGLKAKKAKTFRYLYKYINNYLQ